jgi:hypothetical protein
MDPVTLVVVGWLVQPAAGALFAVTQQYLLLRLGLSTSRSATSDIKPLLDEYLQHLTARLDEDRIAKLYGAFSKLKDAPRSVAMLGLLIEALDGFHEVAQIPLQGTTRGRPNAELRCMAFLGMAASYNLLHDQPELIAEKMVEAVRADADTAKQWLGENLVREIISRLPSPRIVCPKCGFQNPAGSQFCNRDGYPLNSGQTSSLQLIRQYSRYASLRAFQIILDDKIVGVIRNGKNHTIEIQPGRHIIFLRLDFFSSQRLTFDIAPREKVTFVCAAGVRTGHWWGGIGLWKQ